MVQKVPPPPFLTGELQQLNRWLLEIQAILNNSGDIDPDQVEGLAQVIADTAANTAAIAALTTSTNSDFATVNALIAVINAQIVAIQADIVTINGQLTTLGARSQVFNGTGAPAAGLGTDNDWYYNRTGGVGARLYIKLAGTWTAQAI